MIRYKLYQDNRTNAKHKGAWYARAVAEDTLDTARMAEHMAAHSSPYSAGVIHGVLKDLIACTKELVMDGKNVKLDDLAIFSAGLRTKHALSPEKFNAQENIVGVKLRARSTGKLSTAVMTREGKTKQFTQYTVTPKADAPQG